MFTKLTSCRRSIAITLAVLLIVQTTGCAGWTAAAAPTPEALQKDPGAQYRISLKMGDILYLEQVHYRNDSIIGMPAGVDHPKETGAPRSAVASMEKQKVNAAVAIVGSLALFGIVLAALTSVGKTPPPRYTGNFSCPLVYSWDGSRWHLDSGTFGGAITPALARTDLDNLLFARPDNGLLRFRMTDEANETEHVDAFTVLAVDHPRGTDVAPDARANNTFHVIRDLRSPVSARDFAGRDALKLVRLPDASAWESAVEYRDPANGSQLRDGLDVTFVRAGLGDQLQLVVDAQNTEWASAMMGEMVSAFGSLTAKWYDTATSAAASAPMARAQHAEGFLQVSVWNGTAWRPSGEIWEAGPEVAKRQVLPIDVRGISGDTIRVRLESAPSFWQVDYIGLGPVVDAPIMVHELPTISANAPRVTDALSRLNAKDNRFLDLERNDTVSITVRETAGKLGRGMVRSYLARTSGWYQVHGRDDAAPDIATVTSLASGPHPAARLAVTRMNEAIAIAQSRSAHALPR